jgi:feruloyl esterase
MLELLALAQLSSGLLRLDCEQLQVLAFSNAHITEATTIPEGVFDPPGREGLTPSRARRTAPLPAHCRVRLVLTPSPDSNINVELWLPVEQWNGKFLAVGNGGWAGSIQGYDDMQEALRRGYATAGTDTGHSAADGPAGRFALGHPEKIVDFAYRAIHDMTVKSKRLIQMFYGPPLEYSYFKGCSTGGRQGVMAAQRFPGDFDGIIAGALANRHIHMHTVNANRRIELTRDPDRGLSEEKAALVNDAVLAQCDTLGEGFLNDPRQCAFNFQTLACTTADKAAGNVCLEPLELNTVVEYYAGKRSADGALLFSGQAMGNPIPALQGSPDGPGSSGFDTIRILGFQDPDYDWQQFDLERDLPLIDAAVGWVDATDPDLRAYKAHGGKLLLYAGWRDTGITPENTVLYYESVREELGPEQADWLRLFLAPGMGHCRGGPGINTFDTLTALEQWREKDMAPDSLEGSNSQTGVTRPVCPYPQSARFTGIGTVNDGRNWQCVAPQGDPDSR